MSDQGAGSRASIAARSVFVFVLNQIVWFTSVLGAAGRRPLLGVFAAAFLLPILAVALPEPRRRLGLTLVATLAGGLGDSAVQASGLLLYAGVPAASILAPAWIFSLWAVFTATFDQNFGWLRGRPALAAILGAVAGPLSYAGAVRLGAARYGSIPGATAALAVLWGTAMPLLSLATAGRTGVRNCHDEPLGGSRHEEPRTQGLAGKLAGKEERLPTRSAR